MDNRAKVVSNLIWRFMERCGSQVVAFVVSIILARILDPADYGLVAKVALITTILLVFVDSGMANALIQKKDPDDLDYSSVFYFNVIFCLIIYIGLFFAAPYISVIYKAPQLTPVIRVLGLTIVVAGVKNVQQAYVSKTLQFKRFFFATLSGTLFSAVVGIAMAMRGFGIWALVAQQLTNVTVNTAVLWVTVGWKPKKMFSFERLFALLSYGWKLFVSGLLDVLYNKMREIIIAVQYSDADLAFYNRGNAFPNLVVENINSSIDSVLLPVLSNEQDDRDSVRTMTRRAIKTSTYIMMPMMLGMAAVATPFIRLILTDKWLPCVPYLRIFCITYAFYPLHTANLNAIKAMGRSDLFLILEIIKKIVGVAVLLLVMPYGVLAMAESLLFVEITSQIINTYPNKKLLDYSYMQQIKDILPTMLLALFMAVCIIPIELIALPDIITLILQITLGVIIYVAGSILFKFDSFNYILGIVLKLMGKQTEIN